MTAAELLAALIETSDEETRAPLIARITEVVDPIIRRTIQRTCAGWLRSDEIDDVRSTVLLRLLNLLRRAVTGSAPIERFDAFVVALTSNVVNDYLRRRYPERTRLKNRLRYLATHDPALALWTVGGYLVCGLSAWPQRDEVPAPITIAQEDFPAAVVDRNSADAVKAIFQHVGRPLVLDDVISLIEVLWGVREVTTMPAEGIATETATSAVMNFEHRSSLESLWREVKSLPPAQRTALLLNLRDGDGGNALALIVLLGIATFDEVAHVAGFDANQLAEVWDALPMGDLEIAERLTITRQQVINLRKAARRRLLRRMQRTNDQAIKG